VSEEVVPLLAKAQWQRGLLRQRAAQGKWTASGHLGSTKSDAFVSKFSDADLSPIFRSQSSIHSDPISRSSASSTASTIPTINPTSSQNPHRPSNLPNSHSFISASGTAVSDSMGDSGFLPPPPTSVSSAGRPPLRTLPSENSPGSLVQRHGNAMRGDPNQKLGGGGDAKLVSLEGSDDTKRIGKTSIVVWKKKDGFCARGNTVEGYRQMNRAVSSSFCFLSARGSPIRSYAGPQSAHIQSGISSTTTGNLYRLDSGSTHRVGRTTNGQIKFDREELFSREVCQDRGIGFG
jgi:hypothetical protein